MKHQIILALTGAASVFCSAGTAAAQDIVPPTIYTMTPTGVNLSDGTYTFTDVDLKIGGLKLERFHLGGDRDPNDPAFGFRMSHNFDIYITPTTQSKCSPGAGCHNFKRVVVHMGTSSANFFEDMNPQWIAPSNEDNMAGELTYAAGAYSYLNKNGDIYNFSTTVGVNGTVSNARRVANIQFANGVRQDFFYSGNNLKAVTDSSGYAIVFEYNGNNLVSAACGYNTADTYVSTSSTCAGAQLKVSYGYGDGMYSYMGKILTSVTDVSQGVTTYEYSQDISCVKPPGYSTCKIANTYQTGTPVRGRVMQQTLADGGVWNYSYVGDAGKVRSADQYAELEPSFGVTVTDPNNKSSSYSFSVSSPYSATDANGRTTEYRFGGGCFANYFYHESNVDCSTLHYGAALLEATLPGGNMYLAEPYGPRRTVTKETLRAKPGSTPDTYPQLADIVTLTGYVYDCTTAPNTPQNCAKPIWTRDAKGNQTDYTYMSNGLMLTAMQPAPSTGAPRPLKVYTYVQKYAWVRNAGGGLTTAASAIWVPQTETVCQTISGGTTPVCDGAATQTVTTYEYGPDGTANNLRVRGTVVSSGGTSLRTCYGYDWRGNKISQTSPRAGLSVCQ